MIRASRDDENEPFALTSAMPLATTRTPFSVGATGPVRGDSRGTRTWGTRTWGLVRGGLVRGGLARGDSYVGGSILGRRGGGEPGRRVFKLGRGYILVYHGSVVPLARSRESALGSRAFDRRRVRDVVATLSVSTPNRTSSPVERGQVDVSGLSIATPNVATTSRPSRPAGRTDATRSGAPLRGIGCPRARRRQRREGRQARRRGTSSFTDSQSVTHEMEGRLRARRRGFGEGEPR